MIQHVIVFYAENLFGGLFHFPLNQRYLWQYDLISEVFGPDIFGEFAVFTWAEFSRDPEY